MTFKLSQYGTKFMGDCGILQLMVDIEKAYAQPGSIMMGGGNPSHIPAVQSYFRDEMRQLLNATDRFERMISNYTPASGDSAYCAALADLFRREYGWDITADNIALTAGSQTAFFFLFNLFGGMGTDGKFRKILLPLSPEYIGYADSGIEDELFVSARPNIDLLDDNLFKYRVDFDALTVDDSIGAIAVSRPTNPTGNVITDDEITQLSALAQENNIPLILDNAYGLPFPGIIFTDAKPTWEPHIILTMSLSKLGLPGLRTGIIIANKQVIEVVKGMNAVISLAQNSVGSALTLNAVQTGDIIRLSEEIIRPHYQRKVHQTVKWLRDSMPNVDFRIHKPEGAIFVWLWFRDLPISNQALYERLSENGMVVVPGQYFFPGLPNADDWAHCHECIRVSYARSDSEVQRGVGIIADVVNSIS